jgi:hypothetical protein
MESANPANILPGRFRPESPTASETQAPNAAKPDLVKKARELLSA